VRWTVDRALLVSEVCGGGHGGFLVISDLPNERLDLFSEAEVNVGPDTPDDDLVHLEDYWLSMDHNQDCAARVRSQSLVLAELSGTALSTALSTAPMRIRPLRHEFLWPSRAKAHPRIRVIINLVSNATL